MSDRKAFFIILALTVSSLLIALFLQPLDVFFSTDEGNKFICIQSIARTGKLDLEYPARDLDPSLKYFPDGGNHFIRLKGRVYSYYPFWFPLLITPFFRMFGSVGLYFIPVVSTLIFLYLFYRLVIQNGVERKPLAFALIAFATPLIYYTCGLWEHSLALALTTSAILLLMKSPSRRPALLLSGLLLGIAALFREESIILFIAILIAWLFSFSPRLNAVLIVIGWLSVSIPQWILNQHLFGHPLGLHSLYYDPGPLRLLFRPGWDTIVAISSNLYVYLFEFNANKTFKFLIASPFLVAIIAGLFPSRIHSRVSPPLLVILAVSATAVAASLFTVDQPLHNFLFTQGLFPALPFIAVAFLYFNHHLTDNPIFRFLNLTAVLFLIGVTLNLNQNRFGLLWGPRIFFAAFPLLVILAVHGMTVMKNSQADGFGKKGISILFVVITIAAVMIQAHGNHVQLKTRNKYGRMIDAIVSSDKSIVVTDVFWIPEHLAKLYFQKKIMLVRSDREFKDVLQLLREKGLSEFTFVASRQFRALSATASSDLRRMAVRGDLITAPDSHYTDVMVLTCKIP